LPATIARAVVLGLVAVLFGCVFSAVAGAGIGPRFSAPAFTPGGVGDIGPVVADFNGDAMPDIVAIDGGCRETGIAVLLGRGDGNFARLLTSCGRFDYGAVGSAVADVNGDGRPDVSVVRFGEDGPISTWINDGTGRFHRDRVYAAGTWAEGLVASDLSGDGIVDLLTENQARRELVVLLGMGGGRFSAASRYTGDASADAADAGFGAVAAGDVNGDGKLDVVLTSSDTRSAVARLGNGDGSFGPERAIGRAPFGDSVTLADLNNDGTLDVAATLDQSAVVVYLGNGDGTFRGGARYTIDRGNFLENATVADFDADGALDIAVVTLGGDHGTGVRVLPGHGDGTFAPLQAVRTTPQTYGGPVVADFNRDGRPDLVYIASPRYSPNGGIGLLLNSSGLAASPCVPGFLLRKRLRIAKRDILRAGCRLGRVRHRFSSRVAKNRVISQQPRSGSILARDAKVSLNVSRGRRK
jgi:hypothetical protein